MMYIYRITNLVDDRVYIGQHTWEGEGLDPDYFCSSGNDHFWNAVALYGQENFKKEIVEIVDDASMLDDRETVWIQKYFDDGDRCYNLNPVGGGSWNHCHTKEVVEKAQRSRDASGATIETAKKCSAKARELQVGACFGSTSEELSEWGKKGVQSCIDKGVGIAGNRDFATECGKEGGKIAGNNNKKNHKGYCGRSKEQMTIDGKKGQETHKQNQTNAFDPTHNWQKKGTAKSCIKYNFYLAGTDILVYTGRLLYANQMMKRRNQVWEKREQVD